ncbi:hypothetical protein TNCV_1083241 [Trichonephila clavipes]|nr:hypothetical protein TNCV_1083241 [Trichonephila clavipes]
MSGTRWEGNYSRRDTGELTAQMQRLWQDLPQGVKTFQWWLKENVPDFIECKDSPSSKPTRLKSLDLNLLHYKLLLELKLIEVSRFTTVGRSPVSRQHGLKIDSHPDWLRDLIDARGFWIAIWRSAIDSPAQTSTGKFNHWFASKS